MTNTQWTTKLCARANAFKRTFMVASWALRWICFDLVPAVLDHVKETRDVPKEPQFLHCLLQFLSPYFFHVHLIIFASFHASNETRCWEGWLFRRNSLELRSLAEEMKQCYCCDSSSHSSIASISVHIPLSSIHLSIYYLSIYYLSIYYLSIYIYIHIYISVYRV